MQKSRIEWIFNPDGSRPGWTWNPITGCVNHINGMCKGGNFPCYAYKLANQRLKERYLANHCLGTAAIEPENLRAFYDIEIDPFYPRFWHNRLDDGIHNLGRKPKGIFLCDMSDLFGEGIPHDWVKKILAVCQMDSYKHHRFYLLTKQPQNLIKFSPFPENIYLGVTVTDQEMLDKAIYFLRMVDAKVKFLSMEPLLGRINLLKEAGITWVILGACTGTRQEMENLARNNRPFLSEMPYGKKWTAQPSPDWVREIIDAADREGIPVFLKDNLLPLLEQSGIKHVQCAPC